MDLVIAANETDNLVQQLTFHNPPTARYAWERRLVQIMPQGANSFAPNGNQVMMFNLTSHDGWLDPSSVRLHFRIRNTAGADPNNGLVPASGCHCFFSQLRILIGGQEVERIEHYGMLHELFRVALNAPQSQLEQGVEDGREYFQIPGVAAGQDVPAVTIPHPPLVPGRVAPQTYKSVTLTPLAGLLSCGKYLPRRLMNFCVLEFTMARTDDALAPAEGINMSRDFELSQCELQFSTVRLDSGMEAGFASLMLSGRVLTINLNTIMSQQAIIPAGATEFQASVTRALTRITACFVTFQGRANAVKSPLRFHNPSDGAANNERILEWSMQIGSKQWPEMSTCKSLAATMSLLKQALGAYDQNIACTSIMPDAEEFPPRSLLHWRPDEHDSRTVVQRDKHPIRGPVVRFDQRHVTRRCLTGPENAHSV